jgi:hypothetical protein
MRENPRSQPSTIEAGQIWLIEQKPTTGLCPLDRGAATGANVVFYDRALAQLIAAVLPIGSYTTLRGTIHRRSRSSQKARSSPRTAVYRVAGEPSGSTLHYAPADKIAGGE